MVARGHVGVPVVLAKVAVVAGMVLLLDRAGRLTSLADVQTQGGRVNVAVAEQQDPSEDGLGEEVEDTVENGLAVGGDDVAALR